MNFFELIITIIFFYLIYKFVFGVLIPVKRKTSELRSQMNAFNQAQQQHAQNRDPHYQSQESSQTTNQTNNKAGAVQPKEGEYIDFEEIKD